MSARGHQPHVRPYLYASQASHSTAFMKNAHLRSKKKKGMCMNAADFFLPLSMSKYDRRHPYIYLHRYPLELTWHDCVAGWELGGRRVGLTVCKQQALIPSSLGLAGP